MVRKAYTPEQIINRLREAEIMLSQGATLAVIWKKIGVSDCTYYRWRKEYGGKENFAFVIHEACVGFKQGDQFGIELIKTDSICKGDCNSCKYEPAFEGKLSESIEGKFCQPKGRREYIEKLEKKLMEGKSLSEKDKGA